MARAGLALGGVLLLMAACSGGSAGTSQRRPPAPPSSPSPLPCSSAAAAPAGDVWTIAGGLDKPDDVLYAGGALYLSVLGAGAIQVLAPGKAAVTLPVHIASVEGTAFIGQDYYAAGQADDAVYQVTGGSLRKVIQLNPVAGQEGVDGISAQGGRLIVPDSPRGVVDWVDPSSGVITRQVGGFVRPTGAWPLADGSVLIADEYGNAAAKVAPDGSRTYLVRNLPIVDDVAEDSRGEVFAVTPAAAGGRLVQILPGGGTRDLLDHLAAPQGLAVDGADNLYFTEEDGGSLSLLVRNFKLVSLPAVTRSATQPVCVNVARGRGFRGDVELTASDGLHVVAQPGPGSQGAVLVTGCRQTACLLTARSGSYSDVIWLSAHS